VLPVLPVTGNVISADTKFSERVLLLDDKINGRDCFMFFKRLYV